MFEETRAQSRARREGREKAPGDVKARPSSRQRGSSCRSQEHQHPRINKASPGPASAPPIRVAERKRRGRHPEPPGCRGKKNRSQTNGLSPTTWPSDRTAAPASWTGKTRDGAPAQIKLVSAWKTSKLCLIRREIQTRAGKFVENRERGGNGRCWAGASGTVRPWQPESEKKKKPSGGRTENFRREPDRSLHGPAHNPVGDGACGRGRPPPNRVHRPEHTPGGLNGLPGEEQEKTRLKGSQSMSGMQGRGRGDRRSAGMGRINRTVAPGSSVKKRTKSPRQKGFTGQPHHLPLSGGNA